MANTVAQDGLTPQQWDDKFFTEYFQESLYASEFGTSENSIIQVKQDLTKKRGDSITYALANALAGAGVTGASTLVGNEEAMLTRSFALTVTQRRNAVVVSDYDEQLSAIPLRQAGRSVLMDWAQQNTIAQVETALGSILGVAYGSATETNKDIWLVDNADRVLFGAEKVNAVSGDHSVAMTTIVAADDKLTAGRISLMKRIALSASPVIRPVRSTTSGRRYFVVYANALSFRDLKADTTITAAQREVSLKMENERLFDGGDIYWDGCIIKESDTLDIYADVGAGGTVDTGPVYLCGAQAIGYGIAKRWNTVTDDTDYKDKQGVAVREFGGIAKIMFGTNASSELGDLKQHGVVTGYFAAQPDA
jgi:N4-gp56 family major capsid protein